MKLRRLRLESGVWRYRINDGVTELWSPAGKKYKVGPGHTFTTNMCSCPSQWQCFGKGFSPGALRRFIEKHILSDDNSDCYGCTDHRGIYDVL